MRILFLDHLRALLVLLVVVFHSGVGFMVHMPYWWYVPDARKLLAADVFILVMDVCLMPLLMLIAGYFAEQSQQRSSVRAFVGRRALRLLVPCALGVLLGTPAITYVGLAARGNTPQEILPFLVSYFRGNLFHHAHYWFLSLLFLFCIGLVAYRRLRGVAKEGDGAGQGLGGVGYVLLVLLPAVWMFAVNLQQPEYEWNVYWYVLSIQPTRLGIHTVYFVLGVVAQRRRWFSPSGFSPPVRIWTVLAVVSGLAFVGWRAATVERSTVLVLAINALGHSTFCLTTVMALLGLSDKYARRWPPWAARLVRNSFGIYFVHFIIVVVVAFAFVEANLPALGKWLIISLVSLALSWCVSEFALRRLPGLRRVFS